MPCWSFVVSHSPLVLARDGAGPGLFLLILLSSKSCSRFHSSPTSSSCSRFPAQCTLTRWPHVLMCLGQSYSACLDPVKWCIMAAFTLEWPIWTLGSVVTLILSVHSWQAGHCLNLPVFFCNLLLQHKLAVFSPRGLYAWILKSTPLFFLHEVTLANEKFWLSKLVC